jgi:hypothetical protein
VGQIELFLNSVPLLSQLSREAKLRLVDAFVEEPFAANTEIIREGDPGDKFYIVKRWGHSKGVRLCAAVLPGSAGQQAGWASALALAVAPGAITRNPKPTRDAAGRPW